MANCTETAKRDRRMWLWAEAKRDYRNQGGRNWKAAKKRYKRKMRDERRVSA